ncbi:hypothetical protein P3L10_020754 [Capsicum annuum]
MAVDSHLLSSSLSSAVAAKCGHCHHANSDDSARNGKNNGKGYYIYEKGRKPRPDFTVLPIIEESRRLTNIMPGGKPIFVTDQEIVEMILFPVVNEACRVLDEGIVVRASDLDVASVLVMSFPSYRGGIVFWADTVGAGRINRSLKKWSELYGNFFKPSRFLEERAMKDVPFMHLLRRLQLQGHECKRCAPNVPTTRKQDVFEI